MIFATTVVAGGPLPGAPLPQGWLERHREGLPPEVLKQLSRLEGFWWPTMGMVDFLCHNQLFHDPEAFAHNLQGWPIDQFLVVLFNGDLTVAQIKECVEDPRQSQAIAGQLSRFSQGSAEAIRQIFEDPEGHRRALLSVFLASQTTAVQALFDQLVSESKPLVAHLLSRLATEEPLSVAKSLRETPLHLGQGPYHHYAFIPSLFIGHRHIQSWGAQNAVFFFQWDATKSWETNKSVEIADFLKVLSDRTRLDILRLLACGPSYGKELATALNVTTATISRHLDQLKAAGLVLEDKPDADNVKRLQYSPEALDRRIAQLTQFLLHS